MTLNIEEVNFSPSTDFFKRTSSFHGECSKKSLDFLFKTDAVLVVSAGVNPLIYAAE